MICWFCVTDALLVIDIILVTFLLNEFALMNAIVVRNREPSVLRNVLNYSRGVAWLVGISDGVACCNIWRSRKLWKDVAMLSLILVAVELSLDVTVVLQNLFWPFSVERSLFFLSIFWLSFGCVFLGVIMCVNNVCRWFWFWESIFFIKKMIKMNISTWNNINLFELGIFQVGYWRHDSL